MAMATKKIRNPWAVCNAQKTKVAKRTGRKWSKKTFEACVRSVKRKSRR